MSASRTVQSPMRRLAGASMCPSGAAMRGPAGASMRGPAGASRRRDGQRRAAARIRRAGAAVCALALLAGSAAADEPTPRDAAVAGRQHYTAGRYAEALEAFTQADPSPEDPAYADLVHNQAAARFKLGAYADARELWVRVASLKDAAFEARTRYNIGNTHYREALSALESSASAPAAGAPGDPPFPAGTPHWTLDDGGAAAPDPAAAGQAGSGQTVDPLEALGQAIENYRDAVRLDPGLADARANLELAARLRQQLEQQAQPTSQPSERQQDESQQDDAQQNSQPQPSDEPSQEGDAQGDQNEPSEENRSPQGGQQDEPQSGQPEPEPPLPPDEPQDPSADQPDGGGTEPQEGQQPPPASPQAQPDAQQIEPGEPQPVTMSEAEAERLLQMIRDLEQARRESLRKQQAARQQPVEKDW